MTDLAALEPRAAALIAAAVRRHLLITTAESCTGGLIAGLLTEIPGSSAAFERGFVTYSNTAKSDLLGVPDMLLAREGAVSAPVAEQMVRGALRASPADVAVAVTGIAGPGGGSAEKPVGLVFLAVGWRGAPVRIEKRLYGDLGRAEIRRATVCDALGLLEGLVLET
ncbi:CinA family protein [Segnochrobactraceae bacterium EtOH-i3]